MNDKAVRDLKSRASSNTYGNRPYITRKQLMALDEFARYITDIASGKRELGAWFLTWSTERRILFGKELEREAKSSTCPSEHSRRLKRAYGLVRTNLFMLHKPAMITDSV